MIGDGCLRFSEEAWSLSCSKRSLVGARLHTGRSMVVEPFRRFRGACVPQRFRRRCSRGRRPRHIGLRGRSPSWSNGCLATAGATSRIGIRTTSTATWTGTRSGETSARTLRWMRMPCTSRGRRSPRSRRRSTRSTLDSGRGSRSPHLYPPPHCGRGLG